jgi:hypothetical protein
MSITKIRPEHIREYVKTTYKDPPDDLDRIPLDYLYEALCEVIVNENESYTMEALAEEWVESNIDAVEFAEKKLDAVLSPEAESLVPVQHKNKWVGASVVGCYEYSTDHRYADIPDRFRSEYL